MLTVCVNHMTVQGEALKVTHFMNEATKGPAQYSAGRKQQSGKQKRSGIFSLNALVPVPDYVLRMGKVSVPAHKKMTMGDVVLRKRIASGRDWCLLHWGCLEDVDDQKITKKKMGIWYGNSDQASLDFSFETISNPPLRWFEAVFAQFPELTFHIHYELRGQFSHGYVLGMGGECWESDVITEPADVFACNEEQN